jgi:cytochrome P450
LKSYTELLLKQLRKTIGKDGTSKVDLTQWYNFTTFDIMGDLTFGEPLHLLDDTTYTPWVSSIFGNTHLAVVALVLRAWGLEKYINAILPASVKDKRKLHQQHSITRVEKRLAKDTDRPDIWTYVLRNSGKENNEGLVLTKPEMHNNAGLFMLAGTETTATELSGMTYYLLQNPQKLARLTKEIRDAFMAYEDVTINKLSELKYLDACIHEGLRVYPPVAFGLPRASPPGGANVNGQFVAGGVGRSPSILCLINDANGCRLQFNSLSTLPTTHPIISRIPTTLSRSDGCPRDRMSTTQIIRKPCNPSLSDRATVWARSK